MFKLTWADAEEHLDKIGSMESAENWSSVVERAQVRPSLNLRRDLLRRVQYDTSAQCECQITKNGRETLKLWVPVV